MPDPNPSERLAEIEARVNQIVSGKVTLPSDDVRWLLERLREESKDVLLDILDVTTGWSRKMTDRERLDLIDKNVRQALADSGEASEEAG